MGTTGSSTSEEGGLGLISQYIHATFSVDNLSDPETTPKTKVASEGGLTNWEPVPEYKFPVRNFALAYLNVKLWTTKAGAVSTTLGEAQLPLEQYSRTIRDKNAVKVRGVVLDKNRESTG